MQTSPWRYLALATLTTLLVVGCDRSDRSTSSPSVDPGAASANDIAQTALVHEVPGCAPGDDGPADIAGWPTGDDEDASFIPVILSSQVSAGTNRFLFGLTDRDYRVITSPDVAVTVDFYALEREPSAIVASSPAAYLDTGLGRGLYRVTVGFDCAGEWGAELTVQLPDGTTELGRMRFRVHAGDTTPAIGAPAPRSDSLTASTLAGLQQISTDPNPLPGSFERTIAEVVTAGKPSLVFFATPAFCQTGYCGPTVNLVKSVAVDYEDRVGYVNVEPYELRMTENGLQPVMDEDGQLVPVQAVRDYGIPVEPYLFLVDADGNVFAKFEGVIGSDELRASIEDALAATA